MPWHCLLRYVASGAYANPRCRRYEHWILFEQLLSIMLHLLTAELLYYISRVACAGDKGLIAGFEISIQLGVWIIPSGLNGCDDVCEYAFNRCIQLHILTLPLF